MVVPVDKERVRLALGEEIERTGRVSETSIAAAAKAVRKLSSIARRAGVASLDVFLTAPEFSLCRPGAVRKTSSSSIP